MISRTPPGGPRSLCIALLIGRFPPHDVGGAERQAERLAGLLAARGHRVTVITRRWDGRPPREEYQGYTIVRVPVAFAGPLRSAFDMAATLWALARLRPRPDVTLCFQTFASGFAGGLASLFLEVPSVVWVRGENEYRFDRAARLKLPARFAWSRARRVLVQTAEHRQRLLAHYGEIAPLAAERLAALIEVIGNGVDLPPAPAPPGRDWLYVGRLIEHKNVDVLLRALAEVTGPARGQPLWIVGYGPERLRLEAAARALGVDARFEGFRPPADLPAYYARARAILLPSTQGEGLPNAVLEAMAYGVPPVTTDLPGTRELVGQSGLLVPPGDAAALARALEEVSEDSRRAELAARARTRAAAYAWPGIVDRVEGVLAEAALRAPRIWLVSPQPGTRGGIAQVAREVLSSPIVRRYRLSSISTYRPGPLPVRLLQGVRGIGIVGLGLLVRPPDLVHMTLASRGSFARKVVVATMCRLARVPTLVRIHGGGFDQFISTSPDPIRALARWWLEGETEVLTLSERWTQALRPIFPRAHFEVLRNPVEVSRFDDLAEARLCRDREGPPMALFLGELLERKGVFDLVRAWPEVVRAVPGARLVLAGRGEEERLRGLVAEVGVVEFVQLPGWVGFEEKRRLLGEAAVFVLPSYIEGVPISLLEAMAAGLPSVVTPVGGVLDAVTDGREALVVPAGNRAALARAIVDLFRSPELARSLSAAARLRARDFDLPAFAEQLDRHYRRVLAAAARRGERPGASAGEIRTP